MRIIAGRLGGRNFTSPHGHKTHPMSEKARGGLFNALGDISGLTMLDPFAGSGALSFEAISRGAEYATAIDSDRNAQTAISGSITTLGVSNQVKLISAAAEAWLKTSDQYFDIVLIDPPFDNLQPKLIRRLAERVNPDGLVVYSLPPSQEIDLPNDFEKIKSKDYGDNRLIFFKRQP